MDIVKKIYCYAICLICFTLVILGLVDLSSATMSFAINKQEVRISSNVQNNPDVMSDEFYQKKIFMDRAIDGMAKIIFPGIIFIYFSRKIRKSEG